MSIKDENNNLYLKGSIEEILYSNSDSAGDKISFDNVVGLFKALLNKKPLIIKNPKDITMSLMIIVRCFLLPIIPQI